MPLINAVKLCGITTRGPFITNPSSTANSSLNGQNGSFLTACDLIRWWNVSHRHTYGTFHTQRPQPIVLFLFLHSKSIPFLRRFRKFDVCSANLRMNGDMYVTIPRNSCSSALLSGEGLCCMSFTSAGPRWKSSLSYIIIPKNLIRGTLSSHFSLLNTSPCCFATSNSIKLYRFRSCSTSVFPHTTISSVMLALTVPEHFSRIWSILQLLAKSLNTPSKTM